MRTGLAMLIKRYSKYEFQKEKPFVAYLKDAQPIR
jgi:hypothetical protein